MLLVLSFQPLSPSLLLALQRLPPNQQVTVVLPKENDTLSSRLPRHIHLEFVAKLNISERIASVTPSSVVAVFKDNLLLVPEALGLACAVASERLGEYVTFVDRTGRQESRGVVFSVARHWSVCSSISSSFVTTAQTLTDDQDVWQSLDSATPLLQWSALELLHNRKVLTPIPSLAAPLPLSDATNPPGVQWSSLQEFTNKSL